MNILSALPAVEQLIDKFVPDAQAKQQLQLELQKLEVQENSSRLEVLKAMFSNKSLFVSGGIPALIWVGVLSIFNNYVLLPWASVFGATAPNVELPEYYWILLGAIITGILGKKAFDENEIWRKDGTLLSPSKLQVKRAVAEGETAPVGTAVAASSRKYDTQEARDARMEELAKQYNLK